MKKVCSTKTILLIILLIIIVIIMFFTLNKKIIINANKKNENNVSEIKKISNDKERAPSYETKKANDIEDKQKEENNIRNESNAKINKDSNKSNQNDMDKKKSIDAIYEDKCPNGYELNSLTNECYKKTISNPIYTCSEGFNLEDNTCVGETRELIDATSESRCYFDEKYYYTDSHYFVPDSKNKCSSSIIVFTCPTDYVIARDVQTSNPLSRKCKYVNTGKKIEPKITCQSGETLEFSNNEYKCYSNETVVKGYYYCPDGYILSNKMCEEK